MFAAAPAGGCDVAGELEQVVALVDGQPQRSCDRSEHRLRRTRAAALLERKIKEGKAARASWVEAFRLAR